MKLDKDQPLFQASRRCLRGGHCSRNLPCKAFSISAAAVGVLILNNDRDIRLRPAAGQNEPAVPRHTRACAPPHEKHDLLHSRFPSCLLLKHSPGKACGCSARARSSHLAEIEQESREEKWLVHWLVNRYSSVHRLALLAVL